MNVRRIFVWISCAMAVALVAFAWIRPGRAAADVSQTRAVSGFDRIDLEGAFTTRISAGSRQTRVVIRGEPDVIGRITTEVQNGTLTVSMQSGVQQLSGPPQIDIALPVLRGFQNEGASSSIIHGINNDDFTVACAGASSVVASGRAARETITLSGTGKIDTTGVTARDVTVENNGVGNVHVRASGMLIMTVNGVGEIRYVGEPTHTQSQINGIGHIGRL